MNYSVLLLIFASSRTLITCKANSSSSPWPIVVPVEDLREARQINGASQNFVTEYPSWLNLTLFEIGQRYLRENYFGFIYSVALNGFLIGTGSDSVRVAISTGKSTDKYKSMKRYLVNALHLTYWAKTNLKTDKENYFETLNLIHSLHGKVGYSAYKHKNLYNKPIISNNHTNPYKIDEKLWNAFENDLLQSHLSHKYKNKPIFPPKIGQNGTEYYFNQFGMTMQLWSLSRAIINPEKALFYNITDENLWGFLHFWAFIGHGLGIHDKYNVCLQPNLNTAKIYFKRVFELYFLPSLFQLDYEYKVSVEAAVKGIGEAFPIIDFSQAFVRLCTDLLEIDCPNLKRVMSPVGRFYEFGFTSIVRPTLFYDYSQRYFRFILHGITQISTIKHFNINPLIHTNFTAGLIELDEKIIKMSQVCFNGTVNICNHDYNDVESYAANEIH